MFRKYWLIKQNNYVVYKIGAIFMKLNQITMANNKFMPSAPNQIVWVLALVVGLLGILGHYSNIDIFSKYNYEMLLIGFILLAIGTTYRKV